ncbi:MAG: 16S rRNA (uracil(1498)-N(3))-methyltransferase [Alphaproteobacteria bacterium]
MIRLFVEEDLEQGRDVPLSPDQIHYLFHVMRKAEGDSVQLFNGKDGEWLAEITTLSKKAGIVKPEKQTRPQRQEADVWLLFSPLKQARQDFLVEKATELGVSALLPIKCARTNVGRVNLQRMQKITIEAAEQSERLTLPTIQPLESLDKVLSRWDSNRKLLFCAERADAGHIQHSSGPTAILIGPEGGFTRQEVQLVQAYDFVQQVSLGQNILRAETAAIAALSCSMCGK